ncbi:hypothetical protein [Limosilactobacillus reuteri]|uniref:hypothetical protein n=1 Tax=Limosilactobacillus reuteri TaxID=1598 RepID=UPI001E4BC6DF|nr:hypothetical protein [Limosilactobacillus reuteri]MCC4440070.1 hypothetical protein [Limosilactobacillus reuteri]
MTNANYINKIVAFYPYDGKEMDDNSKNHVPNFYLNYTNYPINANVAFYIAFAGVKLNDRRISIHLTISCDDGTTKVDTVFNLDTYTFGQKNIIKELDINSGTFSLSPGAFPVDKGIHCYTATAIFKDSHGLIWDTAKTWFLTKPLAE